MARSGNGHAALDDASLAAAREELVRSLADEVRDVRILEAFRKVPRERFVPLEARHLAYADRPLSIGHGQTISQPRMVAIMLQEMRLRGDEKVLDVGSGSGYQAALLGQLAAEVIGVELIAELAERSRRVLRDLGYTNVRIYNATDQLGWPEEAPYDAIVVGAGAPRVPMALVEQLAVDGRLVIPVGERQQQELMVVEKRPDGLRVTRKGACRFVPLIGKEAYAPEE